MTVFQRSERGTEPHFERGLRQLIDDAAWPPEFDEPGNVLQHWLPQPLLVFSIESRGTLVLPLYEGEEHIRSPACFFGGEHESTIGPVFAAATIEELTSRAFEHYQLAIQEAGIPFDQRIGDYHDTRFFRLDTWPEPLYIIRRDDSERDTIAMMARPGDAGASNFVGRVVRWQHHAAQAMEDEEIRGASLDQVFDRLRYRYQRKRLTVFWLLRISAWIGKTVISIPVIGIQLLLASLIWSGTWSDPSPLTVLTLGFIALLVCLGGSLLILQPLLFPRFRPALGRRGRAVRALLMACLAVLETAALAHVRIGLLQPANAGPTSFDAWSMCFPALFALTVVEWGFEVMFRSDVTAQAPVDEKRMHPVL